MIAIALQEARKTKGMTQEELACKSGVSRTTICNLEANTTHVTTTKTLSKLAKALDMKIEDLFLDDDD